MDLKRNHHRRLNHRDVSSGSCEQAVPAIPSFFSDDDDEDNRENADPRCSPAKVAAAAAAGSGLKGQKPFGGRSFLKDRPVNSLVMSGGGHKKRSSPCKPLVSTPPQAKVIEPEAAKPKSEVAAATAAPEVDEAEAAEAEGGDGFEINDDLQLDEADTDEEVTSPVINSLFRNRVTFKPPPETETLLAGCSDSTQNGASPLLSLPSQPQERRRLDFDSVLTQSAANSRRGGGGPGGFRRCMSMVERPLSLRGQDSSSSPVSLMLTNNDYTSPVSRRSGTAGFKRPMAPCLLSEDIVATASSAVAGNSNSSGSESSFSSSSQSSGSSLSSGSLIQQPSKRRRALHDGRRSCSSPAIGEGGGGGGVMGGKVSKHSSSVRSLSRSKSMLDPAAAAQIMHACNLAAENGDLNNLTGDTRSQLSLPTVKGAAKNHDLKNVDCHTLANVLAGKYRSKIAKVRIIDARYCYEFEGGHIRGAENFGAWDEEAFLKEFFPANLKAKQFTAAANKKDENASSSQTADADSKTKDEDTSNIGNKNSSGGNDCNNGDEEGREILVFHCEFSSARGPALMRKLRSMDRELNKATYPALHYPECYLLHEGYKVFFENYPELCEPNGYLPMAHPNFTHEERKFHKKSKTWAGGGATVARTSGTAPSRLLKL